MVDKVGVDHVLQIAASIVRKEDVYSFRAGVGLVGHNAVVDAVNDVGMRGEEAVCLDLLEG